MITLADLLTHAALAALGAMALSLALTPAVRGIARRLRWLDHPDGERKLHPVAVREQQASAPWAIRISKDCSAATRRTAIRIDGLVAVAMSWVMRSAYLILPTKIQPR